MDIKLVLGITAGVLELGACIVYIWSIFKGKTKPDRVTWLILALVSGMLTASYYASGARDTIWLPAAYTVSFIIVDLLSVKYGEGRFRLSVIDRLCLAGAILCVTVWLFSDSPLVALYVIMITDLLAIIPTVSKAFRRPWTESKTAWIIAVVASLLNVFAIEQWSLPIILYPAYILVSNLLIVYFLLRHHRIAKTRTR